MVFSEVSENHFSTYCEQMRKGLQDKMFFVSRLDADVVVDFGCADGILLKAIGAACPELDLVGYDISHHALEFARQDVPGAQFAETLPELMTILARFKGKRIALLCSSVMHEVRSYGGEMAVNDFFRLLKGGPFTSFIYRDTSISIKDDIEEDSDVAERVRARAGRWYLDDFETRFGSIKHRKNLVHFLLKSPWTANWGREIQEDYLAFTPEELVSRLDPEFRISFLQHEIPKFLEDRVRTEFSISMPCRTHLKLIATRNPKD